MTRQNKCLSIENDLKHNFCCTILATIHYLRASICLLLVPAGSSINIPHRLRNYLSQIKLLGEFPPPSTMPSTPRLHVRSNLVFRFLWGIPLSAFDKFQLLSVPPFFYDYLRARFGGMLKLKESNTQQPCNFRQNVDSKYKMGFQKREFQGLIYERQCLNI